MKWSTKYQLLLYKRYFDTGWSFTNYAKYAFAFAGLFNFITATQAIYIAVAYILFCFFFGRAYFKYGWAETEQEVSNSYNLFVKQMRKKFK